MKFDDISLKNKQMKNREVSAFVSFYIRDTLVAKVIEMSDVTVVTSLFSNFVVYTS